MKKLAFLLSCIALILGSVYIYAQEDAKKEIKYNPSDSIKINHINIRKNWISWDVIIKSELLFKEGEMVSFGQIDTSMQRIWNIGNFAEVKYNIVENEEGNTLEIIALDGFQMYPIITVNHSSENDFLYELGYGDENFLGSNSKVRIKWVKQPTGVSWNFHLGLPRQLLYKNMTAAIGYNRGNDTKKYVERIINEANGVQTAEYNSIMLAPYQKSEFYLELGNPWHLDYTYRFSPDLSLYYRHHMIDDSLLNQDELDLGVNVPVNTYDFFEIKISESMGIINRQRHRLDGYSISGNYAWNIGLNGTSSFHAVNISGTYHKTLNKYIQLTTWLRTGYTTADDQYKTILGSGDVIGLRYGELFGKAHYAAYLGSHFTWVNTKWFTLENAYFVNWGNGADTFGDLFSSKPKASVGTFFELRFPVFPIFFLRFSFMYAGPGTEWFKFNM